MYAAALMPKSAWLLVVVAIVILTVVGVLPSRSERLHWSAEKRLMVSLGTVGVLVLVAVYSQRKKSQ